MPSFIKKTVPEYEAAVRLWCDLWEKNPIGEIATYEAMEQVARLKPQDHRHLIDKVVRTMLAKGIVYENVVNVGYRRLNDLGIGLRVGHKRKGIYRRARRAIREGSCAKLAEMPATERSKLLIDMAGLGAVAYAASAHADKKLAPKAVSASFKLPLDSTLRALADPKE